jgi:hypothetical protein
LNCLSEAVNTLLEAVNTLLKAVNTLMEARIQRGPPQDDVELCQRFVLGSTSNRESFSPSAFQLGEKVPKADEGALVLAEYWTVYRNGRGKLMKTRNFSARTAPSSAFGTWNERGHRGH